MTLTRTSTKSAWATLGRDVSGCQDTLDAMHKAKMTGWKVQKSPLQTPEGLPVPNRFAIVRGTGKTARVLGTLGGNYHPVQNEEYAPFVDGLVERLGGVLTYAGGADDGSLCFVTMDLPERLQAVGGVDPVQVGLAVYWSHTGLVPVTVEPYALHVNSRALVPPPPPPPNVPHRLTVKNSRDVLQVLAAAERGVPGMVDNYVQRFTDWSALLCSGPADLGEFGYWAGKHFGPTRADGSATQSRAARRVDAMVELFASSRVPEPLRETGWAAAVALCEWSDHHSETRGDERDVSRARNAILGPNIKRTALSVLPHWD